MSNKKFGLPRRFGRRCYGRVAVVWGDFLEEEVAECLQTLLSNRQICGFRRMEHHSIADSRGVDFCVARKGHKGIRWVGFGITRSAERAVESRRKHPGVDILWFPDGTGKPEIRARILGLFSPGPHF